jgi:hypothetical protein
MPAPGPGRTDTATITRWGTPAASSRKPPASRTRRYRAGPRGRPDQTERPHPRRAGTPDQSSCRRGHAKAPRTKVRPAALVRPPGRHDRSPRTGRQANQADNPSYPTGDLPAPAARHDPLPGGRVKGAFGAATAGAPRPLTRPPARRTGSYQGQGADSDCPEPEPLATETPKIGPVVSTGRCR